MFGNDRESIMSLQIEILRKQNQKLLKALEPFAHLTLCPSPGTDGDVFVVGTPAAEEVRNARTVYQEIKHG